MDSKKSYPMKILLFKIGAIGDVLMTTPLARQLRKEFPKAKIIYYTGRTASKVLEGNKNLNKVAAFDENIFYRKRFLKAFKLRNEIKNEGFDIAFVLDKHWAVGAFIKSCGIPKRIGFDRGNEGKYHTDSIPYLDARHEINYYLSLIEKIGIEPSKNTKIDIDLSKNDILFADKFFKNNGLKGKVIGIVPGGGVNPGEKTPIRRYPHEKMIELIQKLSKNYKILLLGGKQDEELNQSIIIFLKEKNIINGARESIKESAALMKKCSIIICSDSGPMHIASAVNNKIISLFGPTNPARKAPLHKESISIWHDDDIYERGYEIYGKLPSPEKKNKWMRKITTKEIEEAVRKLA